MIASFRLMNATRNVAASSAQLVSASMHVSAKPKDGTLQTALSDSAMGLSGSIKDLLKVSSGMMPGVVECEDVSILNAIFVVPHLIDKFYL
jgi:talin